ncbi:MAG: PH domain-containing protein, partial [Bacillales bacterium]
RYTVYMRRRNIQSLSRKATYFQKRKNLATIRASIKSGIGSAGGRVVDLEEKDAAFMYRWFSRTEQKETRERPHGS